MGRSELDGFSRDYEGILGAHLRLFVAESSCFAEYRVQRTRRLVGSEAATVLDFRRGIGRSVRHLRRYFRTTASRTAEENPQPCPGAPWTLGVARLTEVAIVLLFWMTPIIYPVAMAPPELRVLFKLSPLAGFVLSMDHALA